MVRVGVLGIVSSTIGGIKRVAKVLGGGRSGGGGIYNSRVPVAVHTVGVSDVKRGSNIYCVSYLSTPICYEVDVEGLRIL